MFILELKKFYCRYCQITFFPDNKHIFKTKKLIRIKCIDCNNVVEELHKDNLIFLTEEETRKIMNEKSNRIKHFLDDSV